MQAATVRTDASLTDTAQFDLRHQAPFHAVTELMEGAVRDGVFPGAVLIVGKDGDAVYRNCFGVHSQNTAEGEPKHPTSVSSVFDIASVSSVMATTTLIMKLVDAGKVQLSDRVANYVQGFGILGKSKVTIQHLLSHTSGLLAWAPFFEDLLREHAGSRLGIMTSKGARDFIITSINRSQLRCEPGTKQVYSDVGLILLGHVAEILTGLSLDKAFAKYVASPLALKSTSYIDLTWIKRRGLLPITDVIAPTEECPWRKRVLWGEVHDDNAWAMGGIAGHSGLFSTAPDVHRFAVEMLRAYHGTSSYLRPETVRTFWHTRTPEGSWAMGWDTPSRENGLNESGMGTAAPSAAGANGVGTTERAVGVCGFTGCSAWIIPERGIDIVLMSNRVHPTRANKKIMTFRPELHRAVMEVLNRVS